MANTIPAWEIEQGDSALNAGAECKRITLALTKGHKASLALKEALQAGIQKHGNSYLKALRQADPGIYSLRNIDDQIQFLREDIAFVSWLVNDPEPEELAQAQAVEFPIRTGGGLT